MSELVGTPHSPEELETPASPTPSEPVSQQNKKKDPLWNRIFHGLEAARTGEGRGYQLIQPILYIILSTLIGAAAIVAVVYTPSYQVSAAGNPLGITVTDPELIEEAVSRVEARVSEILEEDYHLEEPVTWTYTLSKRETISTPEDIAAMEEQLFQDIDAIIESYVLRIDGTLIGASTKEGSLESLLDQVKATYETEDTIFSDFSAQVVITHEYTPATINQDQKAMLETLTANTTEETTYTVESGDTFMAIAYDNDMTVEALQKLNPGINIDILEIGQILTMQEEIPYLSVETVDRITYHEPIKAPLEEIKDDTMYEDESYVVEEGSDGEALITADVTLLNGKEQSRAIVESKTLTEPVKRVVVVGTIARPAWYPKGYFIWPVHGTITSRFGYRNIFGSTSYHGGLDIAVPYGTPVKAADGGTVLFAGTATGGNWSYGNLVMIDHGNGKVTYYGHNSSVVVSAGEHVAQGQTIALAGSTGRSTGSHCHFEVRINGGRVNPQNYLS